MLNCGQLIVRALMCLSVLFCCGTIHCYPNEPINDDDDDDDDDDEDDDDDDGVGTTCRHCGAGQGGSKTGL